MEQLFWTTEKFIKDQVDITCLSTVDWNQVYVEKIISLCDRAVHILKSKTHVFANSVLCLRGISAAPVQAWKDKIKWHLETCYLKDLDRVEEEPMEFEWKIFTEFTML